ncbi:MAG: 4-hydroxy-tetrahydrodipicolinate synthase [Actinobacteria bacterium]|nr:4-hydroxy-tetrahydrodipicolinate synthase [Actinomycetota bacterium]
MDFGKLITAMVTPFDKNGKVDYSTAEKLIEYLLENGSDSVLLAGTTGESPTLTDDEKIDLFTMGADKFGKKTKIIAGTGSYNTEHSVKLSKRAQKAGVDCLLLVTPYYNKPGQPGLYEHFSTIANSVDIPVILYNVPSRTSCNITAQTCIELSKIENIIGIKEASSDFRQIAEIIRSTGEDFVVYSGNDGDTLPMLSIGANGVISVASHLVGNAIKDMIESFLSGDIEKSANLHSWLLDIFYGIFITTNPVPIKKGLNLAGINVGGTRLPLTDMSDDEIEKFKHILNKYDLIKV